MAHQRYSKGSGLTITKLDEGDTSRKHVLETMCRLYGWSSIVEIGVRKGQTGLHLLKTCPDLMWIGIDPYAVVENTGEEGYFAHDEQSQEVFFRLVSEAIEPYGNRALLWREYSAKAAQRLPDGSVDCVFIDGDHRYTYVKEDIELWMPKVAPGGWLTGHDIDWEMTKRAVDETLGENQYTVLPDVMWAIQC